MDHSFWGTTLMRRVSALDTLYARVERTQAAFRETAASHGSPLACPTRCGTCCVHFVPDLLPIEADRLAYFLLTEKREMIDHFLSRRDEAEAIDAACPFWNPDKPGENCLIYPARPLICRLFGFCSMIDKNGEPSFTLCRQMPSPSANDRRHFVGLKAMMEVFGAPTPLMVDFSREIIVLDPAESGGRMTIDKALMPALSKVGLALKFASETRSEDMDDEPEEEAS